jgi:serine protease Do
MNVKRILAVAGLTALTLALAAIPGNSARQQNPSAKSSMECTQVDTDATKVYPNAQKLAFVDPDLDEMVVQDGDDNGPVTITAGRGWLGVGVSEVNSAKAKELKLPAERGVLLGKIVPDSPAAKAALKENDVVTEVNGQRIEGTEQFRRVIREIPAGRTAQLTVWRDGHSQNITVTVGKSEPHVNTSMVAPGTFAFHMPDMSQLSHLDEMMEAAPWAGGRVRLGVDAEDLQGDFGNFFGAPDGEGVLVRGVFPDSPAAKAGLKVGDVITSLDGDRIHSIGELREKMVEKHEQKNISLGLLRNKTPLTLTVEMPKPTEKHEHHNSIRTNI